MIDPGIIRERAPGGRAARTALLVLMLTLPPVVGGCAGTERGTVIRRDSAGVGIVESPTAQWGPSDGWTIADTPRVSIGVEDGAESYQLSRVGGVARLDDGGIAVGDGGSSQLRFYDSNGAFVQSRGRRGQGPEEFAEFSSLRIWRAPNGDLLVNDSGNGRINVFDASGSFIRTIRLAQPPNGSRAFLFDVFADGSLFAAAPVGDGGLRSEVAGPHPRVDFDYLRYSADGTSPTVITRVVERPRYVNKVGTITHFPYIPLTPAPQFAVRGASTLVYRGPHAEIEELGSSGAPIGIIRWEPGEARRVADIWDRYVRESLDGMEESQRTRYEHFYRQDLALPELVPSSDAMLVDATGTLWVRRYRLPWETAQRWDILTSEGEWLGTLATPDRVTIAQVGRDFVLGTHRDSLGVERVQLFDLTRR
jgi:hypothetical protein